MIGFKTEFGLRKESGHIALPLAKTSKGQPEVTRSGLNISLSATGNQANASRTLRILGQSNGSQRVELLGCNPRTVGFGSSRVVIGSV